MKVLLQRVVQITIPGVEGEEPLILQGFCENYGSGQGIQCFIILFRPGTVARFRRDNWEKVELVSGISLPVQLKDPQNWSYSDGTASSCHQGYNISFSYSVALGIGVWI